MSRREADAYMTQARQSIAEAEALRKQGFWASATSRAYYAMFQASQAFLAERNVQAKTHRCVRARLHEIGALDAEARAVLGGAQSAREHADYDVAFKPSRADADQACQDARDFLQRVEEALCQGAGERMHPPRREPPGA